MTMNKIQDALEKTIQILKDNPDKGRGTPPGAAAVIEEGLRCRVEGPGGVSIISDMPQAVGGEESAPTPGWYMRAAHAACDATMIALRAAQLGISLDRLEVSVDSEFDNRGMIGAEDSVPPGPLSNRVVVRISAPGTAPERLREIVDWAESHSPVGDAVCRAISSKLEVEIL